MEKIGKSAGIASLVVFAVFAANVIAGSMFQARFLSDVAEMLMLFLASALFVVLILVREYQDPERGPGRPDA